MDQIYAQYISNIEAEVLTAINSLGDGRHSIEDICERINEKRQNVEQVQQPKLALDTSVSSEVISSCLYELLADGILALSVSGDNVPLKEQKRYFSFYSTTRRGTMLLKIDEDTEIDSERISDK